jgi:hypothetical protein
MEGIKRLHKIWFKRGLNAISSSSSSLSHCEWVQEPLFNTQLRNALKGQRFLNYLEKCKAHVHNV